MTSQDLTVIPPLPEASKAFERVMIVNEIPATKFEAQRAYAAGKKITDNRVPAGRRLGVSR